MLCKLTLEQICTMTESPLFDRKSARIDAKTLAIHLIAFANADGGVHLRARELSGRGV